MLPRPLTLDSGSLSFPALELGPPSGPIVPMLHGFPDTHHGFFEQLEPPRPSFGALLAAAGFRVVAPAMRGLAPTAMPVDGDYTPLALAADVAAHAELLGNKVHLLANDWGAFSAYLATVQRPELFHKMVTLAIPHPLSLKPSLAMAWRARHFVTFQFQKSAARSMRKRDFALVDTLYRRWSPAWKFPTEALTAVKQAYAQPGVVEGALAPYAAMRRAKKQTDAVLRQKIAVPTLALGGTADPTVPKSTWENSRRGFSADYRWDLVPDAGHFPHRENPVGTAERVIAFLKG